MAKKTTRTQKAKTARKAAVVKAVKKSVKTAGTPKKAVKTPKGSKTMKKDAKPSKAPLKEKSARPARSAGPARAVKPFKTGTPSRSVKAVKTVPTAKIPAAAPENKKKKNLSPREKKFLEIRQKLVRQKTGLLSEAEEALNVLPGQTMFPDLGDQASAEIDRNFMLRLRGREQRLLKKIDEAIEKIESGAFGICEVCGQEIDIKRLDARPVTTMCILCKTEQEEEEKARGL